MFPASSFHASPLSVVKSSFFFLLLHTTASESAGRLQTDYFFNQEVADFQNALNEKLSNQGLHQENVLHPSSNEGWDELSDGSGEFSSEEVQELLVPRSNEESQLTSTEKINSDPFHKRKNDPGVRGVLLQSIDDAHEIQSSRDEKETNHPVEEILYIRRSDSESVGSLPDILEEALSPKIYKPIETEKQLSTSDLLLPDTCSASNHSFYDRQTCSSGYQYKLEPHLSATYSDDLKAQMLKRYSPRQETVCGFKRRMNPDKDVTERALCPFEWVVSKRNPSRIPEYMYEAKCSCVKSCAELKSRIRVLWRVGCEDQLHVYREGWEEIAVACVPTDPPITRSRKADRIEFSHD